MRVWILVFRVAFGASISVSGPALLSGAQSGSTPAISTDQRGLEHPPAVSRDSTSSVRGKGKTYALLVGISHYQLDPPVTSLQFAHQDAQTFAELLRKPIGGSLTDSDQIRLLTDERATRAAIDDSVTALSEVDGRPENTLVVFVAAHGVYMKTEEDPDTHRVVEREPYILTFDSNPQDAKVTGYPMEEFRSMVARQAMRFGRVLVFLDVCHAANVGGIGGGENLDETVRRVWEGRAGDLGLMLASHARKFAIESANFGGGHGAFSYFLLSGLNGLAATPGSNSISFADLAVYVIKNVSEFTRNQQTPVQNATNDDMVLVDDIHQPGITLLPAQPLSDSALRALRGRGTSPGVKVPSRKETEVEDEFSRAILAGLLLPEEPGSAAQVLAETKRSTQVTAPQIARDERRLGVALEDKGQQIISKYLEGEENPQAEPEFLRCERYFEEAFRLAPSSVYDQSRALFCQGRALLFEARANDARYDEARRLFMASIRLDPQRGYAYNGLGIAYLEQIATTGRGFDEASAAFRQAMRFAPYWAYPVHNLALLQTERGRFDEAVRLYQQAILLAPRYSYLPYNLGLVYQKLGDVENARISFERALAVAEQFRRPAAGAFPEAAFARNALGTIARSQGKLDRSAALFRAALRDDPKNESATHNLALLLSARGEFAEADRLWEASLALDARFLPSRVSYAESLTARRQFHQSAVQYQEIIRLAPEYVGARKALAEIYLQIGEPLHAVEAINPAIRLADTDVDLLEIRGQALAALGRLEEARTDWKKALDVTKDKRQRARLRRLLG